ncbi:MAG: lipopolysaccharide assembly protein LapA domain-containing protein [Desulfobacterota bacterium]|jgi:uncharacterized integral membrane protein|nr:lipopolysaccharide assembly protein LapA domain-containing protein [Thermodesulfobacteriota bacterium]
MASLKFVLYALLFILFLIFIVQNYTTLTAPHSLHLNLALANLETVPLPLYILALILFFMGFFLALLLGALPKQRLKRELRDCRQQKKDLEKQWQERGKTDQQTRRPPAATATPPSDTRGV